MSSVRLRCTLEEFSAVQRLSLDSFAAGVTYTRSSSFTRSILPNITTEQLLIDSGPIKLFILQSSGPVIQLNARTLTQPNPPQYATGLFKAAPLLVLTGVGINDCTLTNLGTDTATVECVWWA